MPRLCDICHKEPIDARNDYVKVEGWIRERAQGGANNIRAKQKKDEWACRWCVEKLAKKLDPGQGSLL